MQILSRGAQELGITLNSLQLEQFETYYRELAQWNQKVNLTAITGYEEVQVKHFLDSLTVCLIYEGPLPSGLRVMDVGAGAGFPGLPLKLAFPNIDLVLSDSVGKKTRFLRHLLDLLGLVDVAVYTGRAEELGQRPGLRESFDLVVSRGVARLPALLEYTLPFCQVGGKAIAWKHGGIEDELVSAGNALKMLGGSLNGVVPVRVTGLTDNRVLVVANKARPTPVEYPRRTGVPAQRPL